MKTKDIMKILKLVKKSRKHKKRKRHHSKKKVIIAPTQNIQPSALQPYEISRQVPMTGTNNLSLDNLRLTNTLLENKIKEGPEINTKINDINNKLLIYDNNKNNFDNELNRVNRQLLGIDSNYNNQFNTVNNRLNNQDIMTQSAITEAKNYNKTMDDKIDNIYNQGQKFINDAISRKFVTPRIVDHRKVKIDRGDDDDDSVEEVINFETKSDDNTIPNPPGTTPDPPGATPDPPSPPKGKPKLTDEAKNDIQVAIAELEINNVANLKGLQKKKYHDLMNKYNISFGMTLSKKTKILDRLRATLKDNA
jgi:hypothetical protein